MRWTRSRWRSIGAGAGSVADAAAGSPSPAPVSVVIPVRDGARYLGEAIDSVLAQTRAPEEVVVVDDGSVDDTPDVIASYGPQLRDIRLPRTNIATALNRGIAATSGEYVAFLDGDDVWVADKLAVQLDVFESDEDAEAVFGLVKQFLSPDADPLAAGDVVVPPAPQAGLFKTAMLVKRTALDRVGPFDEGRNTSDFMDWYARALEQDLATRIPQVVVARRRIHGANQGIRQRDLQRLDSLDIIKESLDRRRRA
jgi:glycosyltransferase involved in cell wall biosynthesis